MNIPRKPGIVQNESIRGEYREKFPSLPVDVQERFPSLKQHEQDTAQWWFQVRQTLGRQYDELKALIEEAEKHLATAVLDVTANTTAITALTTSLAQLQTQLTALASAVAAIQDPAAAIAAMESGLAAHIADTSTHGVTGNIVGDTDEQTLSSKIIGLTEPRYGRFESLMSRNDIPFGATVDVPAGYSWGVVDNLLVNGTLNVEVGAIVKIL